MSFFDFFLYFRALNSNLSRHELCARKYKKLKNDIFYILPYVISTLGILLYKNNDGTEQKTSKANCAYSIEKLPYNRPNRPSCCGLSPLFYDLNGTSLRVHLNSQLVVKG